MIARVLLGSAMIVAGCALLRLSLVAQFERASSPLYPFPSPPVVPAAAHPSPSASVAPPASAATETAPAPSASASSSAAAPVERPGVEVFHFVAGDVVPTKPELARLLAYANRVRRFDHIKVTLRTYADVPGTDAKTTLLAKRRGLVVRQTLLQLGIPEPRLVNATADVATAPSLAGCLELETTPPFAETP